MTDDVKVVFEIRVVLPYYEDHYETKVFRIKCTTIEEVTKQLNRVRQAIKSATTGCVERLKIVFDERYTNFAMINHYALVTPKVVRITEETLRL